MSKARKLPAKPIVVTEPPQLSTNGLPQLPDHFLSHADFESVTLGPRRELTLELRPLVWVGHQGHHGTAIVVRFGGIVNFEEVKALFMADYYKQSELGRLDYDKHHASRPDDLYLHLGFEMVEAKVVIHCHSLTITEPELGAEEAA